jgi:hypothetical protein
MYIKHVSTTFGMMGGDEMDTYLFGALRKEMCIYLKGGEEFLAVVASYMPRMMDGKKW